MNRADLTAASEAFIRKTLRRHLQTDAPVYLYGSRARETARWNSDYDLWVDAELPDGVIVEIQEELDESFVPFKVDIVTTRKLRGRFGEIVKTEARRWM
jgi:predicted nucleotidyltransferase